jgi:hypothetical protein
MSCAAQDAPAVTLKVVDAATGSEIFFKINQNTEMFKLMNAYCNKRGVERGQASFHFNGREISNSDTAFGLGMTDDSALTVSLSGEAAAAPAAAAAHDPWASGPATDFVTLKVVDAATERELFFKISRESLLGNLMNAHCNKQGVGRAQMRFQCSDGRAIADSDTADSLQLEDNAVIRATRLVESTPSTAATESHDE